MIGNEDCGQMSSWYVFSAIGFYPLHPFNASYERGLPSFPKLSLRVPGQRPIHISSDLISGGDLVRSMTINGKPSGLNFSVSPGDQIHFSRFPNSIIIPNPDRSEKWDLPIQPFVQSGDQVFEDSTCIRLESTLGQQLEYTWDTTSRSVMRYQEPLCITNSCLLFFRAVTDTNKGSWLSARYFKKPSGVHLELKSDYSSVYPASGPSALIDGLRGGLDFRDGLWQGYQGKDLEAIISFTTPRDIHRMQIRFLQDQRSWIIMPSKVQFSISEDGLNYTELPDIINTIPLEDETAVIKTFSQEYSGKVKCIKVKALNPGKMPAWHLGAGGESWIFCDEIFFD